MTQCNNIQRKYERFWLYTLSNIVYSFPKFGVLKEPNRKWWGLRAQKGAVYFAILILVICPTCFLGTFVFVFLVHHPMPDLSEAWQGRRSSKTKEKTANLKFR